jgi:alpha-L-fucosidase 2
MLKESYMKNKLFFVCVLISSFSFSQTQNPELWYKQPARKWTEALPVGNGRLGALVFGEYRPERLQLNEESLWAGSKINNNNPDAKTHLAEIQKAIFENQFATALDLSNKYLTGTPPRIRSYQPLGNLFINYKWSGIPSFYKRSLNLQKGISKTEYTIDGNKVKQEVYVSATQDVVVVTITSEKGFDADISLSRNFDVTYEYNDKRRKGQPSSPISNNTYAVTDGLAYYTGQIIDSASVFQGPAGKHMRYATAMKILSVDGKANAFASDTATGYSLRSVKRIVLMITGATDYNLDLLDTDSRLDPLAICKKIISKAALFTPAVLQQTHEKEHRSYFDRVSFSLGKDQNAVLATDERLARIKEGKTDNELVTLYYQYGRYLLMGSSRKPGRLPANLQGIWNDLYDAPWNADFHTNINLQMNYWPAETANLTETVFPLANFVKKLTIPGAVTAKEMYGAKGWTMHHLTDPFGRTGVMDGVWGITNMDGPWMTFPLYDHFEFSADTAFLKNTAYPIMKGSVEFVLDFLIKSPEGYLVTNPSHSPENSFFVPGTNKKEKTQMTYAPTVDIHIINALFNNFIKAATILHLDKNMIEKVTAAQKQLPPLKVSALGTLQEWIQDYEEVEPGHRHMSHLLGLYPLELITPKDPVIFEAAKKTMARRLANGGGHTGWSKAWIINLYARVLEPEKAYENLNDLLRKSTLDNLFDTHPPFQIDGNFGATAAIAEMLLQSQNGIIRLLPALPAAWAEGSVHGLRARGACTVDMDWKAGKLTKLVIRSDKGGSYQIAYNGKIKETKIARGASFQVLF